MTERLHFLSFFLSSFYRGFPGSSANKEYVCNARDPCSIPGSEDLLEKEMAPTPVFWPGESRGQRSLAGYRPWVCKQSDMTEQLSLPSFINYLTISSFSFFVPQFPLV